MSHTASVAFSLAKARASWFALIVFGIVLANSISLSAARGEIFNSTDQGWYHLGSEQLSNGHLSTNDNFITYGNYNNFFTFNLASSAGMTITSAVLRINNVGTYSTGDAQEIYRLFDYAGSISDLVAGGDVCCTSGITEIYNDLGSGVSYGQTNVGTPNSAGPMPVVAVTLNAAAITDINYVLASSSLFDFAIGGNCISCEGLEFLWGNSGGSSPAAQLILQSGSVSAVPLPATLPLFIAALSVFGLLKLRTRSRS